MDGKYAQRSLPIRSTVCRIGFWALLAAAKPLDQSARIRNYGSELAVTLGDDNAISILAKLL